MQKISDGITNLLDFVIGKPFKFLRNNALLPLLLVMFFAYNDSTLSYDEVFIIAVIGFVAKMFLAFIWNNFIKTIPPFKWFFG